MKDSFNIPGFELVETIGQGGMATVWKARQVSLDRVVAIKLLNPQAARRAKEQERLLAEAHAAANLKHSGIVQVYDAGIVNGISYFVMEFVAGYSVGQWLRRKTVLPHEDAIVIAECVAHALNYAWKTAGIIHCDIKPDNIMVDLDGAIKVADLGLARSIKSVKNKPGQENEIMGTPGFIAPEQSGGQPDLDCRADIYSLGATLYNLTTGKRLFESHSDTEAMDLHVTGHEKDPILLQPSLPLGVAWLIEKMLVKDRRHRYADWDAVLQDIEKVKSGKLPARPFPPANTSTVTRCDARARMTRVWEHQQCLQEQRRAWSRRVPVLAGILGLMAITLLIWLDLQRRLASVPPPAPEADPPAATVAPPEEIEVVEPPDDARDLYNFVMRWIDEHPNHHEEGLRLLERVAADKPGSQYALMAETEAHRMRQAREAAIEQTWQSLEETLADLAARNLFREAADHALRYDGPWHEQLAPRLKIRAAELTQSAEAYEYAQEQAEQSSDRQARSVLDQVADLILEESVAGALAHLEVLTREPGMSETRMDLEGLAQVLRAALRLDSEVLESFVAQIGQEITIEFTQGTRRFFVRGARDERLRLEQRLEGGARVEFEFGVTDLATSEYVARLGDLDRHEVALMLGRHAFRERDYAEAAQRFTKTHPMLATLLLERTQSARRNQLEDNARQEFKRLLRDLNIESGTDDLEDAAKALDGLNLTQSATALRHWAERFRATYQDTDFLQSADDFLNRLLEGAENDAAPAFEPGSQAPALQIEARDLRDMPLETLNPRSEEV